MSHGGKRKGAGRKPRATKLEAFTIRLEPDHAKYFRYICQKNNRSQALQVAEWIKGEVDLPTMRRGIRS